MKQRILFTLLCGCATAPLAAQAQTPRPPSSPDAVQEVVVTAQRREERLQDVPIAITAVSKEALQNAHITNTRDLQRLTPGLVTNNAGYQFRPTIRGVGAYGGGGAGDEPNVAVYVDNVYYPSPGANTFQLPTIDRIEVLKGPQGTLFGRNATGGAIRIVTADPSYDPALNLSASYGFKLNSKEFKVDGTTGITKGVAANLAAYYYDDDGYVRNLATGGKLADTNSYTVRMKLLLEPIDELRFILGADYGQSDSTQFLATNVVGDVSSVKNVLGYIRPTNDREVSIDIDGHQKAVTNSVFMNAVLSLDSATITSTTAYRLANVKLDVDSDRSNLPIASNHNEYRQRMFSQEVVAASRFEGPVQIVGGLFFFRTDNGHGPSQGFAAPVGVVNGVRQITGPVRTTNSVNGVMVAESYSAFGEATWDVTDALTVIGGVRYTQDHKKITVRNNLVANSPLTAGAEQWDNVSYRFTGRYKFSEDQMVYGTASSGFKSGAFNASAYTYPNPPQEVQPEKLEALEVGYKGSFFDRRLRIAASAFDYSYDNIQISIATGTTGTTGGATILTNAASAKIRGAEIEIGGKLDEHWSGQVGVSYLPKAEYSRYPSGIGYRINPGGLGATLINTDFSGRRMLYSPKTTVSGIITYETELPYGGLAASLSYFRTSKLAWQLLTEGDFSQKAYDLVNASLRWKAPDEHYFVELWATNLADTHYATSASVNATAFGAAIGAPREVGVRVSASF